MGGRIRPCLRVKGAENGAADPYKTKRKAEAQTAEAKPVSRYWIVCRGCPVASDNHINRGLPSLLGFGRALCFPVARLGFTVPLEFRFPFDGIGGDFPVVFHGPLIAVELTSDRKGDFIAFDLSVLNFAFDHFAILAGKAQRAGDFFSLDFQFQRHLAIRAAIAARRGPGPVSGRIRFLVLRRAAQRDGGQAKERGERESDHGNRGFVCKFHIIILWIHCDLVCSATIHLMPWNASLNTGLVVRLDFPLSR
jgi:hypothetical protein